MVDLLRRAENLLSVFFGLFACLSQWIPYHHEECTRPTLSGHRQLIDLVRSCLVLGLPLPDCERLGEDDQDGLDEPVPKNTTAHAAAYGAVRPFGRLLSSRDGEEWRRQPS